MKKTRVYARSADMAGIALAVDEALWAAGREGKMEGSILTITLPEIEVIYPKTGKSLPETMKFLMENGEGKSIEMMISLREEGDDTEEKAD